MTAKINIQPELAIAITEVIDELATELDLHYDGRALASAGPTITKMQVLVAMLVDSGYPVPNDHAHIVNRYDRSLN